MMSVSADISILKWVSIAGVIFGVVGVLVPGMVYRGSKGERYSFLNHYISELGELGVSRLAWIFNLAMFLCGLCIVVTTLSLGMILPGFWAKAGMLLGAITGLALSSVGLFPMNNMKGHMHAAVTFFRAGLLMVLFFSLAIVLQKGEILALPRWLGLVGLIPVLAFGIFLGLMWSVRDADHVALSTTDLDRPRVWKFAISEWSIYFSLILWILVIALGSA